MKTDYPFLFNNEDSLHQDKVVMAGIVTEAIFLHGADVNWISQELNISDEIFGETNKMITVGVPMRLYCEQIETDFYEEDSAMYAKFGISLNVGEAMFEGTQEIFDHFGIQPKVQDLIYYPKTQKIFEVNHVNLIDGFKLKLTCTLFNYDHTEIAEEIDDPVIESLESIDDLELEQITTPIITQIEEEEIIDEDEDHGMFD